MGLIFPTTTKRDLILGGETKSEPLFYAGMKGEPGDKGITGITGNGEGYPLATEVDAEFATLSSRTAALEAEVPAGWTTLSLLNSWTFYGSGYFVPRYRKVSGVVQLDGLLKHPTTPSNNTIAILPSGFRPPDDTLFYVICGDPVVAGRLDISPIGVLLRTSGSTGYISLGGICYKAA